MNVSGTVSWIEVLWIAASGLAIGAGIIARRWALVDLRYVQDNYVAHGRGRHIERAFKRDVVNVWLRIVLACIIFVIGLVAATQPNRPTTPSGWIIVGLLFTMPLFLVWKTSSEALIRKAELADVADAYENGGDP